MLWLRALHRAKDANAAIALLAKPLVSRPVEEDSAAPERGEHLAPQLLAILDRKQRGSGLARQSAPAVPAPLIIRRRGARSRLLLLRELATLLDFSR